MPGFCFIKSESWRRGVRERDRETETETDRERQRQRETERDRDGETARQRETERVEGMEGGRKERDFDRTTGLCSVPIIMSRRLYPAN